MTINVPLSDNIIKLTFKPPDQPWKTEIHLRSSKTKRSISTSNSKKKGGFLLVCNTHTMSFLEWIEMPFILHELQVGWQPSFRRKLKWWRISLFIKQMCAQSHSYWYLLRIRCDARVELCRLTPGGIAQFWYWSVSFGAINGCREVIKFAMRRDSSITADCGSLAPYRGI